MNSISVFVLQIVISVVLSGLTLMALNRPLKNILQVLCPSKIHADFWLSYTRIMLSVTPLLLVLLFGVIRKSTELNATSVILVTKSSMIWALCGLWLGLLVVGRKIIAPINKQCQNS